MGYKVVKKWTYVWRYKTVFKWVWVKKTPKKKNCRAYGFRFNEAKSRYGKHRCRSNCHCDGARTCSRHKWCQGKSRPTKKPKRCRKVARCARGSSWNKSKCTCVFRGCPKGWKRRGKRCTKPKKP